MGDNYFNVIHENIKRNTNAIYREEGGGGGHEFDSTADGYLELAVRDREVVAVALDAELVEVLISLNLIKSQVTSLK